MAIEYGMTSKEFWKDDPRLFSSYYKKYIESHKKKYEEINYSSWLEGAYIYNGLQLSLTNFGYGFLAGKSNPNKTEYPEQPWGSEKNEKYNKIEKRKKQIQNQQNLNYWARIKR